MITHVAIIWKNKLYSLPKPYRHHNIIYQIYLSTGETDIYGNQGFLDDKDNFLNREEALTHAKACNQLLIERPLHDNYLYSENIW